MNIFSIARVMKWSIIALICCFYATRGEINQYNRVIKFSQIWKTDSSFRLLKSLLVVSTAYQIPTLQKSIAVLALDESNDSNRLQSFLSRRVRSFDSFEYRPAIDRSDVFYPSWFQGNWKSCSSFINFDLPLGLETIGGKKIYDSIRKDVNSTLCYRTSFIKNDLINATIADRINNVKMIAIASMGNGSIIDDTQLSDPRSLLRLIIKPNRNNSDIFEVRLITTDRVQNDLQQQDSLFIPLVENNEFEVMERTTQIITPLKLINSTTVEPNLSNVYTIGNLSYSPSNEMSSLRKDIETITTYKKINDYQIFANQRTATFLNPMDPRYKRVRERQPEVINTAIDIRQYSLIYTKEK